MWFASSPSNETLAGGDPNKVVGSLRKLGQRRLYGMGGCLPSDG